MNHIEIVGVSKIIQKVKVLDDINLLLHGGKVYSFQGENGSGKTMLFRVLSGLSMPTAGEIYYNGIDINKKHQEQFKIGIVLEHASLYPQFTGKQNLRYLASINKLIGEVQIDEALLRVGLDPNDNRTVRKYSLGMRKRLMIAQAIMEKPDFLFLDEPTNAVDKRGVQKINNIIRQESERGCCVLLASHIAQDVSAVANHGYEMDGGRIISEW